MALTDNIVLNTLSTTRRVEDTFINAMSSTMRKLESNLLTFVNSTSNEISIVDTALARQNIEAILLDSGYYNTTGSLLDTGYQDIINEAHDVYIKSVGENFQFSDTSIERLNSIKQLDLEQFGKLGDDFANSMTRTLTDLQFGAISNNQAIDLLRSSVSTMTQHAQTWVTTGLSGIYRESSTMLAEDNGITKFVYVGPVDRITRDFCRKYIGQKKTKEEWNSLLPEQGQGLAPVSQYLGGWNCRHQLIGVE